MYRLVCTSSHVQICMYRLVCTDSPVQTCRYRLVRAYRLKRYRFACTDSFVHAGSCVKNRVYRLVCMCSFVCTGSHLQTHMYKLSLIDVVVLITGKAARHAAEAICHTCQSYPEVADRIGHLKFFGRGQTNAGYGREWHRGEPGAKHTSANPVRRRFL